MSAAMRVLVTCLAAFGAIMVLCLILGFLHWIIIGAVIVGVLAIAVKSAGGNARAALPRSNRGLQRRLRKLEKDLDAVRKR